MSGWIIGIIVVVVGIAGNLLYTYLWIGKPENKQNVTTKIPTLSKALSEKLQYVDHQPFNYAIIYMNVILPAICILRISGMVDTIVIGANNVGILVVEIVFTVIWIIGAILLRFADEGSYWLGIVVALSLPIYLLTPMFTSGGIGSIFSAIVAGIWALAFTLPTILYFRKRKDVFYRTAKQLRKEWEKRMKVS